ncbi:uncharacterized protein LOC129599971 [Paramacrobiotus metropolitanus]|uniref:uncharacterized protein LOC129599971 n=1 Tax=Paramacrobiotus metropolitanus TaxID=2943436 RepID=UPI002445B699|nr:uncharacterized protein LOC129599971 [Paramacrobiotus metropolitanus]
MKSHYIVSRLVGGLNEDIGMYVCVVYVSDVVWTLFCAAQYVIRGISPTIPVLADIANQQMMMFVRTLAFVFVTDKGQEVIPLLQDQAQYEKLSLPEALWLNGEVQRLITTPPAITVWGMARIDRPFIAILVGTFATYILLCWDSRQ